MGRETGQIRPEQAAEVTQRLPEAGAPGASGLARGEVLADRYVVEGQVGSGGRGTVYRAFDRGAGAWVAIKLLNPGAAAGEEELFRELRVARAIQHPHVCRIFDVIRDGARTFLTMEFASRGTLADTLKQGGGEAPDRLRDVGGVIAGLAAIHEAGLLHRDLKPENVLRMQDGRLVLSDFGLARRIDQTQVTAEHAGTPGYIAPELLSGTGKPTAASDVWSLGVVLRAIAAGDAKLERATRAVVRSCLDADPDRRPRDASALLRRWMLASRSVGRRWLRPLAGAALGLALVLGLVAVRWRGDRAGRSANAYSLLPGTDSAPDWWNSRLLLDVSGQRLGCLTPLPPEHRQVRVLLFAPAKALELDSQTGQITPTHLSRNVFHDGRLINCPQTAPDGRGLLWSRMSWTNQREIWYSPHPDGEGGRLITRGSAPRWLPSGREFVFNTDGGRLAKGTLEGRTLLFDNDPVPSPDWMATAVDPAGSRLALLTSKKEGSVDGWLDIYDIGRLTRIARHEIAGKLWQSEPRFDPRTGHLQLPVYQTRGPDDLHLISYWSELDPGGHFRVVGRLDGGVIGDVAWTTAGMVFRSVKSRRLLLQGPSGERTELPAERPGPFFGVAATGDAVYSHHDSPLTNVIRLRRPDGRVVTLGQGHHDFTPDISRDGRWIVFIRNNRNVVLCERPKGDAPRCETIVKNVHLMERGRVRVSPDGGQVAFIIRETTTGSPFLRVFSRKDGQVRDLGEIQLTSCPLHWGAGRKIWHVSSSPVEWVGADAETGRVLERSGKPGMRLQEICNASPPDAPPNPYKILEEKPESIRLLMPPR